MSHPVCYVTLRPTSVLWGPQFRVQHSHKRLHSNVFSEIENLREESEHFVNLNPKTQEKTGKYKLLRYFILRECNAKSHHRLQ